jgi:hypothetical protein
MQRKFPLGLSLLHSGHATESSLALILPNESGLSARCRDAVSALEDRDLCPPETLTALLDVEAVLPVVCTALASV